MAKSVKRPLRADRKPAPDDPGLGPVRIAALTLMLQEARQLEGSHAFRGATNQERRLLLMHIRFLEALLDGTPSTPLPTTHHA